MKDSSDHVLELFRQEHRSVRTRLAAAAQESDAPAESASRLRGDLPVLREQLLRYCRLECEVLEAALKGQDAPLDAVAEARARCTVSRQLLERLEAMSHIGDDATFLAVFRFLASHVLAHLDTTESRLLPLVVHERVDPEALRQRVLDVSEEHAQRMPAATRAEDGRLDIGTAEDRSPAL